MSNAHITEANCALTIWESYLDHKSILKHDSAQARNVGRKCLPCQEGPGVNVKVNLHVVGAKEEPVLRPREHRLVIVVGQQSVFCCGQRGILGPLLHIGHSGYQLQSAPCWLPATHWPEIMPAWLESQFKASQYGRPYRTCAELPETGMPQAQQCVRRVACTEAIEKSWEMNYHPSCSVPSCTKRCQSARAAALSIIEGSQPSGRPK